MAGKSWKLVVAAGCTKCEPQTLSPEAAACREQISTFGLIRAGGTDEEAWQAMVKGLENYKRMCLAHGDENDFSDGNGADANERRRIARWAKKTWLGCLEFYEKHTIRTVFSAVSKDAVRRYAERWNKKFGAEQKELRIKYSWPLPPTGTQHDRRTE